MSPDPVHILIAILGALAVHLALFNKWTLPVIARLLSGKQGLKSYAHHEAGHALALMLLDCGKKVKRITITPALSYRYILPVYTQGRVICDHVQEELNIEQARNWLICEFAGEAAENILADTKNIQSRSARRDKRTAQKLAQLIDPENADECLKIAQDAAYTLLAHNKDTLERIAGSLLKHKTLSGDEALKLL